MIGEIGAEARIGENPRASIGSRRCGMGQAGEAQLDSLLRSIKAEIVAFDAHQAAIARDAARTFGRGRHRAALNFGDCFSYALALSRGEPLLFVGEYFASTDVTAVAW